MLYNKEEQFLQEIFLHMKKTRSQKLISYLIFFVCCLEFISSLQTRIWINFLGHFFLCCFYSFHIFRNFRLTLDLCFMVHWREYMSSFFLIAFTFHFIIVVEDLFQFRLLVGPCSFYYCTIFIFCVLIFIIWLISQSSCCERKIV